jgi:hypothetical protein
MTQCRSGQVGTLHPAVQYHGLFAVLGKERDGDPGHDSILVVHYHATNFQRLSQMTFVIEGRRQTKRQVNGECSIGGRIPSNCWFYLIVRQTLALEKTAADSIFEFLRTLHRQLGLGEFQRVAGPELAPAALAAETRTNCPIG